MRSWFLAQTCLSPELERERTWYYLMAAFETGLQLTVTRKHKDGATCTMPIREDLLNSNGGSMAA